MKTCSKCKEEKSKSEFHKNRCTKDGLVTHCKDCVRLYGKARAAGLDTNPLKTERERLLALGLKYCPTCEENRDLDDFNKACNRPDGRDSQCKDCKNSWRRGYNATEKGKKAQADYAKSEPGKKSHQKYDAERYTTPKQKNQRKAGDTLRSAVKSGELLKLPCEKCPNEDGRDVQGHHWSYEREHWLDVEFLCSGCHRKEHNRLRTLSIELPNESPFDMDIVVDFSLSFYKKPTIIKVSQGIRTSSFLHQNMS